MARCPQCPGRAPICGLIARVFKGGSQPLHLDWDNFELVRWPLHPSTPTPTPTHTATPTITPTPTVTLTATITPTPTASPIPLPTIPPPSGPVTITYQYDSLYRLTGAVYSDPNNPGAGDRSYQYTYDAVGNRLSQTITIGGVTASITYAYDAANRLISVTGNQTPVISYQWDNNGNLLSDGVNTYTYDAANRLISITQSPNYQIEYRYNGLNDRLQETANGSTTTFTMDLNTGLTQALSDGTHTYTYGLGRIAQYDTTAEYFLGDALGSVRQLADAQGRITLAKAYNPYGEVTQSAGAGQSSYGYTDEYQDGYNDLVYLRARHYAPAMGRFLSRDTWGGVEWQPITYNRWGYAGANSVNYYDPSGHSFEPPRYSGPAQFIGCFALHSLLKGNVDISAGRAVQICRNGFAGYLWTGIPFNLNTDKLPASAHDLFGRYLYESYAGTTDWLVFNANEPLTQELASGTQVNNVRIAYYSGLFIGDLDPPYHGGDTSGPVLYHFNLGEFVGTMSLDIWDSIGKGSLPLEFVLGSFKFQVMKVGQDRLGFRIDNDMTIESGTHIVGRFPDKFEGSVEELIENNLSLADRPLSEVINIENASGQKVISILKSRKAEDTPTGGGSLYQTFAWTERYNCLLPLPTSLLLNPSWLDMQPWGNYASMTQHPGNPFP